MSKLVIESTELDAVYQHIKAALGSLQLLLADLGCLHANSVDISSFADKGRGARKIRCPDCNETFEEELNDDMEI